MVFSIQGLAYPLEVSNGGLALSQDADLLHDHILSFLETEPLERVMALDYGTRNFLFTSQPDWGAVAAEVEARLIANIPQCEFTVASSLNDAGEALLQVNWWVKGRALEQQQPIELILS